MADSEQLKILRQGGGPWNAWRKNNPDAPINLRGAALNGVVLHGADLRGADLGNANISDTSLRRADLTSARLTHARMLRTNLSRAILDGADLGEAVLYETNLTDLDLTRVTGLESCDHRGPSVIDHRTLRRSGQLPLNFLRGCGLPDGLIDYLPSLTGRAIEYYSCFISYSHADQPFARRLHAQLQDRGIRCWLDEHAMLPGDDIHAEIDRGIRLYDKVLLCCSRDTLKSWWVDNEIESAFAKEREAMAARGHKVLSLIPLNLDGALLDGTWTTGKTIQITSRLAADFTGWETDNAKFEAAFEKLVAALRADGGGRERV